MKTVKDIRSEFIGYFEKQGHEHVSSSPLVPQNDPTLMFTNAGMVQFKDVFTGKEKRDYSRATTAQKCVRAGGKHNDLENVGYTARHHTFFEMLGNFSFGDYFKEEAISYAWELVSGIFEMPKDKLLITVYSEDEEAAELWKKIAGFSDDKIIRIPTSDNFWMMGDTGPCGPCSEIFYDQGDQLWGGPPGSPEEDGDRFLEFWNLVFMQFEQEPDGNGGYNRTPLPKPSIDTGMGLERMAGLMQGKLSNYDTDLFLKIIEHCADLTGVAYAGDQAPSHRVIADHLRSAAFLMADGVMPSNEGRGYVLRRIMRRGMRHAHILGAQEPLMYKLLPTLVSEMGEAYPELRRAEAMIKQTLESEEKRFKTTLDKGLKLLDDEVGKLGSSKIFSGETAFKLYDTYGFPLDLTQDALKAQGIEVDQAGFDTAMQKQKQAARAAWSGSGDAATEKIWFDLLDEFGPSEFLGYEAEKAEGKILAIVKDGKSVDALQAGEEGFVITNQTPFYAESGGQVGDKGVLMEDGNILAQVTDTKKMAGKIHAHKISAKAAVKVSMDVEIEVDHARRSAIRANHSATHLLHEALRRVLGEHVAQKGSLQDDARTRFDISHPNAITADEIAKVEAIVNAQIRANTPVETKVMELEEARAAGAMALFGEKYDDEVRVVQMGTQDSGANNVFSVELCGGTHVRRTGDIGVLKIISEGALSSGVRRVEAVTSENALRYFEEREGLLDAASSALKIAPANLPDRLQNLLEEKKKLEREVADLRKKVALGGASSGAANDDGGVEDVNGVKFVGKILGDLPPKDLKPMADELKKQIGSGVVVLIAGGGDKASVVIGVTDDLTAKISAVDLVRVASESLGGKGGGGRPDMAQAGGSDYASAAETLTKLKAVL